MQKIFILICLAGLHNLIYAQKDTAVTVSLDQLQVPASPAFNILGIAPNNIERPKNPTDFAFSLGNATSGFSAIPKDYAIEFAPYWIFKTKKPNFVDFFSNKSVGNNILQTATISAASTTAKSQIDSAEFRKIGVALKFSIFRGNLSEDFKLWEDSISSYLNAISKIRGKTNAVAITNDSVQTKLILDKINSTEDPAVKKFWTDSLQKRQDYVSSQANKKESEQYNQAIERLKLLATRKDFKRYGFKMDFAFGTALDYPDTTFQTCYVSKVSTWLTTGWENPNSSFLFLGRFSENINRKFRNDSGKIVNNINIAEFDYGIHIFKDFTDKLTLSFEYIRRLPIYNRDKFEKNIISQQSNSSKYTVSLNYKVGKNQNLSFVYGKNFDNTYLKQGNLIAALNLMLGFGSNRPLGGVSK